MDTAQLWPDHSRVMIANSRLFDFKGWLHSDMLLQEWLVPNVNVWLVLLHSQPAFHFMDFGGKLESHVCIDVAIPKVHKVKVAPSGQLCLEKVLTASGVKYPPAHVVTRHFTLAAGTSMADVDAMFKQSPTKVIISLMSNEAFLSTWQKIPSTLHQNLACLVLSGRPLPAQPWQPDNKQGLYAEAYHALLKSSGMYPSDWSNGLSANQFVGGTMLLSGDMVPESSDGVAHLSP